MSKLRGFTLIELLAVIAIIAILVAILIPVLNMAIAANHNKSFSKIKLKISQ